jgi:flagellin-like protein
MFENIERDDDDRGQVGIGTLIVFIALVLVAAIAAGVLINTAGFLQNQAESTGQESTQQVSERLQVQSAYGIDTGNPSADDDLEEIQITVTLAPGAEGIDLEDATYQYVNSSETILDSSNFNFNAVTGDSSPKQLVEGETTEITIVNGELPADLHAGNTAELAITTASGGQTVVELNVPEPLPNDKTDGDGAVKL